MRKLFLYIAQDSKMAFGGFSGNFHNRLPTREEICRDWVDFLINDPIDYRCVNLPALHTLGLDFSDWQLGQDEVLCVSVLHLGGRCDTKMI